MGKKNPKKSSKANTHMERKEKQIRKFEERMKKEITTKMQKS